MKTVINTYHKTLKNISKVEDTYSEELETLHEKIRVINQKKREELQPYVDNAESLKSEIVNSFFESDTFKAVISLSNIRKEKVIEKLKNLLLERRNYSLILHKGNYLAVNPSNVKHSNFSTRIHDLKRYQQYSVIIDLHNLTIVK